MTGKVEPTEKGVDKAGSVLRSFLIFTPEDLVGPLSPFADDGWEALVGDAAEGLASVVSAASLPFQLTQGAVHQRHFDRFHTAARIRELKNSTEPGTLSSDQKRRARGTASQELAEFLASADGIAAMRDDIVHELYCHLQSPDLASAAGELLRQSLISTWGVFETFASSFFVEWINADPSRARPILSSPDLRGVMGKGLIDISALEDHEYDLTQSMGTVIFRGRRFDALHLIRAAFEALLPDARIRAALGDTMWELNQRRHLLVHRRGLVDREFRDRSKSDLPLGSRLEVTRTDVELYLIATRDAISEIARVAQAAQQLH